MEDIFNPYQFYFDCQDQTPCLTQEYTYPEVFFPLESPQTENDENPAVLLIWSQDLNEERSQFINVIHHPQSVEVTDKK